MGNYEPTTFFILENEELGTWWVGKKKMELDAMDFPARRSVSQSELLTKLEKKFETHHKYTRPSLDIRFLNSSGFVSYGIERFLSKLDYKIRKNPQMYEELRKLYSAGWTNDDFTMPSTLHVLHIWNPNKLTNINDVYSDLKENWGTGGEGQLRSFHKLNKCLNERISKPKDEYLYQKGRAKLLREMKKTGKRPKQSTIEKYKITPEEILYIKEMPEEQLVMEEAFCEPCEPPKFYKKGKIWHCPCNKVIYSCSKPECKIMGAQMGLKVGGSICEHNRFRTTCKQCGGSQICEHNTYRSTCKKCGGSQNCKHDRQRSLCKPCGGSSICKHDRQRSKCKECGGGHICDHNKRRSECKQCGGSQICEHNTYRSTCKKCGGSQICEHSALRFQCKKCGGSQICEHNRIRSSCKKCGGSQICEHNKVRSMCKKCGGGSICEHNKSRSICKQCGGGSICKHNKRRSNCKICHPQSYIASLRRGRRWNAIKTTNPTHTLDDLGMTSGEWLKYLHKTFEDRYGRPETEEDEVHIDEIIPCSAWDLPDDNKYCWHYLNSQLLLAEDNLSKHDSYEEEDKLAMIERIQSSL